MNEGIIVSRYAKAFLQLVRENGSDAKVVPQARQVLTLLESLARKELPTSCRPEIKASEIIDSLGTALGGVALEKDLCSFISLLVSHGRAPLLCAAFRSFLSEYYIFKGIKCGVLKVARLDDTVPLLEEKLKKLVRKEFDCELELETKEDPSLVGGFVFALEDRLLDASVRRQLTLIRRQYSENNRRII
ncbi:MAG: F0F1 ATP synthase subunit delta [Candidatus Cryptobacteroides sp.]